MSTPFSVMTWNVENLFPPGTEYGPDSPEVYERKLNNLAGVVSRIAPDVLALQEIGDPLSFAALRERLGDAYPHARLAKYHDDRGIRVAVISRVEISSSDDLLEFPRGALRSFVDGAGEPIRRFGRGPLRVRLALGRRRWIDLLAVHLKSKLISYPNKRFFPLDEDERARETGIALAKRAAEAVALRVYINDLLAGNERPMVVLGDFNDEPEAVSSTIVLGPEDGSLEVRDRFDDVRLYNLAPYLPPERRYSRIYRKRRELIDHILVSHELIFRLRLADSFVEPIESIGQSPAARRDKTVPDHAAVYARFELD